MPKILHLNHAAYIGGAEVALVNLLTLTDRRRYAPVVFAPPGELPQQIERDLQIRCAPIPALPGLNRRTLPRFLARLPLLLVRIARERPALIYANTNFAALYSGIIGNALRVPSLAHIRDIEPLGRMARRLVRLNTRLIAISGAVRDYLIAEGMPPQRIARVYDGVDLRQYQPKRAEKAGTGVIIGIIGQLGERKGHLILLDAMRGLIREHADLRLWIVGKEPAHGAERYADRLREYVARHGLSGHVEFLGFRADIPDVLAQIDLLALPSLQEPFGKIVIEAMAMEKPVAAARVGGVPEIVEDGRTGLLVPPQDADALRHALDRLIRDPDLRERLGVAGRMRVERHFRLERNVRETEAIYEEMLFKKRPAGAFN